MDGYWTRIADRRLSRRRALVGVGGATAAAAFLAACGGSDSSSEEGDKSGLVTKPVDTLKAGKAGRRPQALLRL